MKTTPANMEITTRIGCKIMCRVCPQDMFVKRYREVSPEGDIMMSLETFKTCIDKLPADAGVNFSGMAEPWLNPACTDMVLYAAEKGHPVALFTTLVGMTKDDYLRIRHINFPTVVLHIPDQTGGAKIDVTDEYAELLDMIVEDEIAGKFHITKYSCHGPVHEKLKDIVEKSHLFVDSNLHSRAGNVEEDDVYSVYHKGSIKCQSSGWQINRNVLLPDGSVVLCSMDFGLKHIMGNLLKQDYDEIIHGEVAEHIRDCMKNEGCGDCLCRQCAIAENNYEHFKRMLRKACGRA